MRLASLSIRDDRLCTFLKTDGIASFRALSRPYFGSNLECSFAKAASRAMLAIRPPGPNGQSRCQQLVKLWQSQRVSPLIAGLLHLLYSKWLSPLLMSHVHSVS